MQTPFAYFLNGLKNIGKLPFLILWTGCEAIFYFIWSIIVLILALICGVILCPIWMIRFIGGDPDATYETYSTAISGFMSSLFGSGVNYTSRKLDIPTYSLGGLLMGRFIIAAIGSTLFIMTCSWIEVKCDQWKEEERLEQIRKEQEKKKYEKEHPITTGTVKALKYIFGDA